MSVSLPYEPIQLGAGSSELFGWYHAPRGESRGVGVVLCNPIGDDYVRSHRAFRHLALALVAEGFAVLRFDFRGTGDSAGSERDAGCAAGWPEDVRLAAEELRARSGARRVALVGLRLGAALAAAAGASCHAEAVVLWNAQPGGAAFVDEATKLHRMHALLEPHSFAAVPPEWASGGQETLGFLLTEETVASLSAVDVLALRERPAPRALVLGAANVPAENRLAAHLGSLGVEVFHPRAAPHRFLMQVPHKAEVPTANIDEIVRWLVASFPPAPSEAPRAPARVSSPALAGLEEPLVFGADHPLFGMLIRGKAEARARRLPAIIMANAGSIHRIGPHRFYVPMARRWAALGFDVLRMDVAGIGDSPALAGHDENLPYPESGLRDVSEAMNALAARTGAERFVVFGHCSGGDHAFQAGLRDPRVVGAVMLNPRTFCVNDLEMIESYKRARYYQRSALRAASWKKALRGDVDFRRAIGMVVPKFKDLVKRRAGALVRGRRGAPDDVAASLRAMVDRGVDVFLLASERDPGVYFVDARSGRDMARLRRHPGFRREELLGMDHTFTALYAQERLTELITDHLRERHVSS